MFPELPVLLLVRGKLEIFVLLILCGNRDGDEYDLRNFWNMHVKRRYALFSMEQFSGFFLTQVYALHAEVAEVWVSFTFLN